jgi:AraC-like DNA-binding protein
VYRQSKLENTQCIIIDYNDIIKNTIDITQLPQDIPLWVLLEEQHAVIDIYNLGFDEYLHVPIIPQQAYYRLNSIFLKRSKPFKSIKTGTKKHNEKHLRMANLCTSYLLEHLSENHSLASIANALGTNRNSLAVAFKDIHKIGVFTWLRKQRLLQARHLVSSSDQPIQSIAYSLGFSDPSNFTNAYKLEFGLSPREARQLLIMTESDELFEPYKEEK